MAVRIPFVAYYVLQGTNALFTLLTWVLAWAAVGRVNQYSDFRFYSGDDRGTVAVSALMAIIAMVLQAFIVYDILFTVRGQHTQGPLPFSHWRMITLAVLIGLVGVFVIVCGAVSGASLWINSGVVGAYVAFAVLTFIVNVLWLVALQQGVFAHNDASAAPNASRDVEMTAAQPAAPAAEHSAAQTGLQADPEKAT